MIDFNKNKSLEKTLLSIRYIIKWSLLSIATGIVVGLLSTLFKSGLNLALGLLAPLKSGNTIYILPIIGLFLSGVLTSLLAPEAAGHGTNALIKAYNKRWGKVKVVLVPVKMVSSIFTIAFGGSAGMEDPAVQMGGSIASFIGDKLNLKLVDLRKIVICGMGAAFGAIFTAPLAGGIFGAEIIYRDDLEYNSLFICFLSSITSYFIFAVMLGQTRLFMFPVPENYNFFPARDIFFFIAVGLIIGLVGLIFVKILHGYHQINELIPLPDYFRTALGGLLTGLTALIASPLVLGTGITLLEKISVEELFSLPLLLALLLGKIAATSFTIGSGASGGTVVPSLTIGGLTGALIASTINYPHPTALVATGSVGLLGAAANIPITTTLLAVEIFGVEMIIPATIVCFIASWIARNDTLYRESLVSKATLAKAFHHFEETEK